MRRLTLLSVLIATSSCIRSVDDIPGAGEGGFVTGVVVQRDLQSGTFTGQAGIRVAALGTSISAITDERGFFNLTRLPLGRITVTLERRESDGVRSAARILDPVEVLVGGQVIDLGTIQLLGLASLEGAATLREANAQPRGVGGTLVVAAQTPFKAITGDGGAYLLPGLPEGSFDVVAFRNGYGPARAAGVQAQAGLRSRVRDLVLPAVDQQLSVTVRGTVAKTDSEDGSGVTVAFTDETQPSAAAIEANTDATGAFSLELPTGVYRAVFSANGYRPVALPGVAVLEEGVVGLLPVTLSPDTPGDLDGDGIPDDQDDDRDNDGCPNSEDSFPDDAFFCVDTDSDGIPNEIDTDDDDDGLSDAEEVSPGEDGFVTNPLLADSDGDGIDDADDVCPALANPGQDPSDCIDVGPMPGADPEVRGFTPARGGPGTMVTVEGRNFRPGLDSFHAVRFGDGAIERPRVLSATQLQVVVPYGAQTGTVSVYVAGLVGSSTDTFTVLQAPELVEVSPASGRPSADIALFGRNLTVSGLLVQVGGTVMPQTACAPEVLARAGELAVVCIRIPQGATSGLLVIDSDNGRAQRQPNFPILPGPVVTRIRPNPATLGAELTLSGFGFRIERDTDVVEVEFASAGGTTRAPATVASDSLLLTTVPNDAVAGPVLVIHPAGDAPAPNNLSFGQPNDVLVTRAEPTLVQAGDALVLSGVNLDRVVRVHFGGAVSAVPSMAGASSLQVIVPAGIQAGDFEVEDMGGGRIGGPSRLSLLQVDGPVTITGNNGRTMIPGWFSEQGRIYMPTRLGTVTSLFEVDESTLAVTATLAVGFLSPGETLRGMFRHPTLPIALAAAAGPSSTFATYVLDIPSLNVRGRCDEGVGNYGGNSEPPPSFAEGAPYAFVVDPTSARNPPNPAQTVLRIDLSNGTCTRLIEQALGSTNYYGAVYRNGELVVTSDDGTLTVGSIPGSATDDQILAGPTLPVIRSSILTVGLGPGVYGTNNNALGGLIRFFAPPSAPLAVTIDQQTAGWPHPSANKRWALILPALVGGNSFSIFDFSRDRIVRQSPQHNLPMAEGYFVAAHPTLSRWVVGQDPGGRRAYKLSITP